MLPCDSSMEWYAGLHKWELSCMNVLERTFGKESLYCLNYQRYTTYNNPNATICDGIACLESAKEEIEKGFLYKIERLISADLFDSILEHAEFLLSNGHKDSAAVLGRVVIENTLKRIAERESIAFPDKVKKSKINEILWKNQVYDKFVWRLTQDYINLGNSADHGDFGKYSNDEVEDMLVWIRRDLIKL